MLREPWPEDRHYRATEARIRFNSDRRPCDLWKAPRSNNSSNPSKSLDKSGTSLDA